MFNRVLYFFVLIFLSLSFEHSYAQFPYNESFRNSVAPGITFGGNPKKAFLTAGSAVGDPEGDGYLRLTDNSNDQTGFIYSDASFPSKYGLKLDLEYYTYGGNGADGITFFLFDASVPAFNPGAFGGSLGYAQKHDPLAGALNLPGVSGGYLAIGLDEYGNFSNPIEGRQGGVHGPGPDGISPSSITLRGKGNGPDLVPDNYKYLTSVQTETLGFLLTQSGNRQPDSTKEGYRRVLVDLKPAPEPQKGYLITVKITTGGTPVKTYTVIDNYYYDEESPANLKYGIASSTGFQTNIHEIRNVFIDVYDDTRIVNPVSKGDTISTCMEGPVTINILANDNTPNSAGTLDPLSIDLDPSTPGRDRSIQVPNQGTFTANNDGTVTFTPANSSVSGPVNISYVVTDSYSKTSSPATITVLSNPPATADAGAEQAIRISSGTGSTTLQALAVPGNTGLWTQLSGPAATINDNTAPNAAISNLVPGIYVFRWTVSAPGRCTASHEVRIVVTDPDVPTAIDDAATTTASAAVSIAILANDQFINLPADLSTIRVVTAPAQGTAVVIPASGQVTYTPTPGYSGTDSFTYNAKNTSGIISNTATVTVTVSPVGSDDEVVTSVNTPLTIQVKENDLSSSGTTVIKNTDPGQGTAVVNSDGTLIYTPRQGYNGQDSFTYVLSTADGITSAPVTVLITVNIVPVAEDDIAPPSTGGPIEIDVTSNDRDADGNIVKGTIEITDPPKHGTITIDKATGKVRYVPDPGYFGPDSFSYVVRDDKGGVSSPGTVNITVLLPPKIGLAKAVARVQQALNGSYNVDFIFTVKNFGGDTLQNLSLQDDLASAFEGTEIRVTNLQLVGSGLSLNTGFNGTSNMELLNSSSVLAPGAIELVSLSVNIRLISREGLFNNTAHVTAFSSLFNTQVDDQSTNGLRPDPVAEGNVSYSDPTPLELAAPPLFIPGGFSPNQDGINDLFVIQNKINKKITLEIFNRWGSRVYKSADYQNDWDGTCTEGVSTGGKVPNGTYYYVVRIDEVEKRAGYITINR